MFDEARKYGSFSSGDLCANRTVQLDSQRGCSSQRLVPLRLSRKAFQKCPQLIDGRAFLVGGQETVGISDSLQRATTFVRRQWQGRDRSAKVVDCGGHSTAIRQFIDHHQNPP
jgi:hypothetical protein